MSELDVAAQQARINQLALLDVDALAEEQRLGRNEMLRLPDLIKKAVEDAEYARAATLQQRIPYWKQRFEELAAARAMSVRLKRRKDPAALLDATELTENAASVWSTRVQDVCVSLAAPVNTALAVIAEGLRLAASEGVYEIKIRSAPDVTEVLKSKHVWDPDLSNSRAEHELRRAASYGDTAYQEKHEKHVHSVTRTLGKVDYFVDVGFCWIPVGRGLGVPSETETHDATYRHDFATLHKHHKAFAGFAPEVTRDLFVEMAESFDGNSAHVFGDLDICLCTSEFGKALLRWNLNAKGYASKALPGFDALVKEWHRKNHAARVHSPTADVLPFRSEEFRGFVKPHSYPPNCGVMLLVAHGESGERLRKTNGDHENFAEDAGFTKADHTNASFVEYVEAIVSRAAVDTYPDGFVARRTAIGQNSSARVMQVQPDIVHGAGTPSLRNLCAREKFWQRKRMEGEAVYETQAPASPSSTPGGGSARTKTAGASSGANSPSITPMGSTKSR